MATDSAEPYNHTMYLGITHRLPSVLYAPNLIYRVIIIHTQYAFSLHSLPLSYISFDGFPQFPHSSAESVQFIHMARSRWNTIRVDIIFVYNNLPNSTQVTENFDYECQTLHGQNSWFIDSHMAVLSQHTIPKKVPRIASKISL